MYSIVCMLGLLWHLVLEVVLIERVVLAIFLWQEQRRAGDRIRSEQANEHNNRNLEQDEINEAQFQEYAREVIEHSEKRGRNVYPLRKVAAQVAPGRAAIQRSDYLVRDQTGAELPKFQTCATDAIKQSINGKDETPKRLGFVW